MRVLIVRLGAFGDIIHTLPLAADLHAAGCQVGWLCEDRWADLLRGSPAIAHLHLLPRGVWRRERPPLLHRLAALRRLVRQVRASGYDAVIDAQGLAKSAAFAAACGAPLRLGHRRPRAREGSHLIARRRCPADAVHVIDQQRALGLGLPGLRHPGGGWRFPLPPWADERTAAAAWLASQGRRRPWLLNVGAGWPSKVWPAGRASAFCRLATQAGHPPVLLWGGDSERCLAETVAAEAPGTLLAPATTLPQLAGLIAAGAVLVSADTGPLHLGLALGTPTVGLFGPVPGERNGPRGRRHRVIQGPGRLWERHDPAAGGMAAIDEAAVLAAALAVADAPAP